MLKIEKIKILEKEVECGNINLILGANNSGKSTLLRELSSSLSSAEILSGNRWLTEISVSFIDVKKEFDLLFPNISSSQSFELVSDMDKLGLNKIYRASNWNEPAFEGINNFGDKKKDYLISGGSTKDADSHYYKFIIGLKVLIENCEERLSGPFGTTINQITDPPDNIVHFLYAKREIFSKVRDHLFEVFKIKITFDNLQQGQKHIRVMPTPKISTEEEILPEKLAEFWSKNSQLVGSLGDGFKAYLKICYALYNPAKNVILIDEPEAFLHPPQRRSLGKFIARHINSNKQVFIATHDNEILRGLLSSSNSTNTKILHLRNNQRVFSLESVGKGNVFNGSRELNESLLNSFFHKITMLCEAEDDRMVYQFATEKYYKDDSIDINFIGCNGKIDVLEHYKLLKKLDLKPCCVLDIDALYSEEIKSDEIDSTDEEKKLICGLIQKIKTEFKIGALDRKEKEFSNKKKKEFKTKGIEFLKGDLKKEANNVIAILQKYGIYIVKKGILESWIGVKKSDNKKVQKMINEIDKKEQIDLKKFIGNIIKNNDKK